MSALAQAPGWRRRVAGGGGGGGSHMMQQKYRADPSIQPPLEGCIVVTNRAVYELRPDVPAEALFYALLAQGQDKAAAEALGKTVGLDLYQLYEAAADQVCPARQVPRVEPRAAHSGASRLLRPLPLVVFPRRPPDAGARAVPVVQRAHVQADRPVPAARPAGRHHQPPTGHPRPARQRLCRVGRGNARAAGELWSAHLRPSR